MRATDPSEKIFLFGKEKDNADSVTVDLGFRPTTLSSYRKDVINYSYVLTCDYY